MQEMMLKIFEEQRKADVAEREKDRQFMLQPRKIFAQKQGRFIVQKLSEGLSEQFFFIQKQPYQ